jgi:hypothetical protein
LKSGYVPMLFQPRALLDVIRDAAKSVMASQRAA